MEKLLIIYNLNNDEFYATDPNYNMHSSQNSCINS